MIHEVLGTFLVGTYISTALFAYELIQLYRYFKIYPITWRWTDRGSPVNTADRRRDRAWIPIMILWMLAMDMTSMVALHLMIYTVRTFLIHECVRVAYQRTVCRYWLGKPCQSRHHRRVSPPISLFV